MKNLQGVKQKLCKTEDASKKAENLASDSKQNAQINRRKLVRGVLGEKKIM